MIPPVQGPVIQGYSNIHHGIDIACLPGSPVVAMMDGYGFFSYNGSMGWQFTQTARDGLRIVISHLQGPGPNTWYLEGQLVSSCGSTGRLSAGPHVHVDSSDPPRILAVFDL